MMEKELLDLLFQVCGVSLKIVINNNVEIGSKKSNF